MALAHRGPASGELLRAPLELLVAHGEGLKESAPEGVGLKLAQRVADVESNAEALPLSFVEAVPHGCVAEAVL